ncbi:MAG: 3-dehydroquinate synthase [Acidobacteria bacterium]|nr:3-dehydroquinate synthase [Acidobacteriota bacterium]
MDQSVPLRIDVRTPSRTYPAIIGPGTLAALPRLLDEVCGGSTRFIVSNPTVWGYWGSAMQDILPGAEAILVPDGERHKTLPTALRIYDALLRAAADRSAEIVTFGGGVVGDVGGFAAATYLRGLALVHVPTTLLAQVDAAIGGKVGVNLPAGKNLVGAFYQPWAVVIDPSLLATLPRREFRAGLYEVIKYGVACDAELFARLRRELGPISRRDPAVLTPVIADCCRIKAAIVAEDERESGARRVLNFGHTVGHALEAATRYRRFRHGEAVAYGMLASCAIASARGVLAPGDHDAVASVIAQLGPLPPVGDLSASAQLDHMRRDKKVHDGRLHFVLPTGIGAVSMVTDVSEDELARALRELGLGE